MILWSITGLLLYLSTLLFIRVDAANDWGTKRMTNIAVSLVLGPLMLVALIGSLVQSRSLISQFR